MHTQLTFPGIKHKTKHQSHWLQFHPNDDTTVFNPKHEHKASWGSCAQEIKHRKLRVQSAVHKLKIRSIRLVLTTAGTDHCWLLVLTTAGTDLDSTDRAAHTPSTAFRHLSSNRAPLSGTFLQTLPDLVTPLMGHSLSPRSCPPTRSAPYERFRYYDCRSNLAPKHARKHETHPPRVKERVPSRFKRLWFYLCWCKLCWPL